MSNQNKLPEKKEGLQSPCPTCGQLLVCRMTNYQGPYPNKLQWQYQNGMAHFTKDGFCKGNNQLYDIADPDENIENVPSNKQLNENAKIESNIDDSENLAAGPKVGAQPTKPEVKNDFLENKQKEIKQKIEEFPDTPDTVRYDVHALTLTLEQISREVESTLKGYGDAAPDKHKVGMFTKIIFNQMFNSNPFKKATEK